MAGDLKTEVRRRSRNIPITQLVAQEMTFEIVGDLRLQMVSRLSPFVEESGQCFDLNKQLGGLARFRRRTRQRSDWIDQVGRQIGVAALLAVVTILFFGFAVRTRSTNESIGQKDASLGVEELVKLALDDQIRFP